MPGDMVEALEQLWQTLLDLTGAVVIPDWGALIDLLPVFLVIGVLGPIISLMALAWFIYAVRRPRTRVTFVEGPRPAQIADDGHPIFPSGESFCSRDALVYPFGATRCDTCGEDLSVECPKCGTIRSAFRDTCASCGLVLQLEPRVRTLQPTGPRPGGAALA
jgi:hypothetical protein